jgi:UDP-N-acetylglucosamine diphosphorylase / glucose-1-phosphate thymidylyltransferase / UDP-N-acetylgalactosamine diphosphorylase / glucosamine-1-phosphate N-acetyltransferase / galactosamine-1-phosphate N-acetyltransferase
MLISEYIETFLRVFGMDHEAPWKLIANLDDVLENYKGNLVTAEYHYHHGFAIHKEAVIEEGVIMKGKGVIGKGAFIGAHAYLRGGIFIGERSIIGPGCEVKSSIIMSSTALAHFNFVGDSMIGDHVNMEAGSIVANHHNDRSDKTIMVRDGLTLINTAVTKFGALIGDHSKIGANAVLSPGTLLPKNSIVKRLSLIDQVGDERC